MINKMFKYLLVTYHFQKCYCLIKTELLIEYYIQFIKYIKIIEIKNQSVLL